MERSLRCTALAAAVALALILSSPVPCAADSFSLFGVKFGATKEEVAKLWTPMGDGWSIPDAPVRQVATLFDHQGRLVRVTFAVDLPLSDPGEIIGRAFQQMVDRRWSWDQELGTTIVAGRYENQVTIWNKKLMAEYIANVEGRISSLLKP